MWTTILPVVLMSALCMARPQQLIDERGVPQFWDSAYQFAYAVASPEHGDYHGHQQSMDEYGHTSGSYYLLGADGQWSQTIYADKGLGFQTVYNQRPAGAPPPQVSEVTYQVFVHPGATAISAQGGAPPAPIAPFGGIRQESLVDPSIAQQQQGQQGRRFNRESSSLLVPFGDPTIDAAFAHIYEAQNVQQWKEKVESAPWLIKETEPETVYYISEKEPTPEPAPSLSRETEPETVYYISEKEPTPEPAPSLSIETEPENVYYISEKEPTPEPAPSLSRETELENVYYISEKEPTPEPAPRLSREAEPDTVHYISEQEPAPEPSLHSELLLQIPGAITSK